MLAQGEGDVVEHRHVGEQRAELEQHAHPATQRVQTVARLRADVLPVKQHLAALRTHEAADQPQHRGLAAPRTAHDRDHPAARKAQVQVRQNEPVAIAEVDVT